MIKVPYTQWEMQIALLGIEKKFEENKEALEKVTAELGGKYGEGSKKTEAIASHYGITVLDLINSPNYSKLVESFDEMVMKEIIGALRSEVGLDDKEAWGVMCLLTGNLKDMPEF